MKKVMFVLMIAFVVTVSMGSSNCYAQDNQSSKVVIYFHTGKSDIVSDYMSNKVSLEKLDAIFSQENKSDIESVNIDAFASPDGTTALNDRLAQQRAEAVKKYIVGNYPNIPALKINSVGVGVDWSLLRELVEKDKNTPQRENILRILRSVSDVPNVTTNELMALGGGSWDYMLKNMYPQLRVATVVTVVVKPKTPEPPVEVLVEATEVVEPIVVEPMTEPVAEAIVISETFAKKPLFALKTNLLFDIATALNVEIEVPIGKRWSIAGEYIFPWWLWEKKQTSLEVMNGNLEGRYWLGNRENREVMTGWFAGIYGGGGYYDLEWKKKGYQGEFYSVGLTGGFTHKIGKNLRMEYSLGLGYLGTKYRKYKACDCPEDGDWHLIRERSGHENWIGPTRVKISLVWMLNKKYIVK